MRKLLEVQVIERPANPFDSSQYPGPGIYQHSNPYSSEYRPILPGGIQSEGSVYFIQGRGSSDILFTVPIECIRFLPDAPEPLSPTSDHCRHSDGVELQPGAMVVPQGSGFVSEAGLIEICRALAHCPPNAPGQ